MLHNESKHGQQSPPLMHSQQILAPLPWYLRHEISSQSSRIQVRGEEKVSDVINDHISRDRISELPDCILLHIMNFMDTKVAVQTSVLSKLWKNLCRELIKITLSRHAKNFTKFVSWVLFKRDNSVPLLSLSIRVYCTEPELLNKIIKYAEFHNVQDLALDLDLGIKPSIQCLPLTLSCQSLTSLKLSTGWTHVDAVLPKSLHLSALKILHLENIKFTPGANNCAEPFSKCHVLNTIVLGDSCSLDYDARVLCISSATLLTLRILSTQVYGIELSTPNLCSFTVSGSVVKELYSRCDLSFLVEVNILLCLRKNHILMAWLHVLANVKILTFSVNAICSILMDIENPLLTIPQPPSFVRLKSLKVKMRSYAGLPDERINKAVKFLLQNDQSSYLKKLLNASK